jgi:methyl-accepting chemotaxis protein
MTEYLDRRTPNRVRAQLEAARTAGAWMPWAGAALALLLWGGIAAWLVATIGPVQLLAQPPLMLAGGFAVMISTGLALICAGVMAREGARSAEANQIVLTSARLLLEPAEATHGEVTNLAEAISRETQTLNKALGETRSRLDGLKHDIESSVTAALKAAEIVRADSEVLVHKMSSERQSLTQLAESLRNQSESLAKSIPRHAQMMSEAARAAQDQVRQADATLDQRLKDLQETAGHLASRIDQLDTMGAESRKRAQNLGGALARLDEQLVQSTRMVEAATKAGELAQAAAKSTAESLRDTVSDALGSAMKATETINAKSAQAAEDARTAMIALKDVGLQAEATTRAATIAARQHADETEKRANQLSESLFRTATRATNAAEDGLERARQRIEKASLLIGQMRDDNDHPSSVDDLILEPEKPVSIDELVLEKPRMETLLPPLFAVPEAPRPVAVTPIAPKPALPKPIAPKPTASGGFDDPMWNPMRGDGAHDDELVLNTVAAPRAVPSPDPLFGPEPARNNNASWRGLLSGIEEVPLQVREQSAGQMIDRLDRAGVRLQHVVKASDLRRIATASHHGERQRRHAIRDVAPGEIQRVSRMLEADRDLRQAARSFVTTEEPDALRVLSMAERAREDAAPRLSAYLLLDAALGAAV